MHAILEFLRGAAVFVAFLAARFALLLIVLAALTVVFLAGLAVVRAVGRVRRRAMGLTRVGGLLWRPGVFYAPGHAWLQATGAGRLRVGISPSTSCRASRRFRCRGSDSRSRRARRSRSFVPAGGRRCCPRRCRAASWR